MSDVQKIKSKYRLSAIIWFHLVLYSHGSESTDNAHKDEKLVRIQRGRYKYDANPNKPFGYL